tara:strand:+ start:395 stop:613 length:219 start_codon:yes stop_codon:yes gene_type:complete
MLYYTHINLKGLKNMKSLIIHIRLPELESSIECYSIKDAEAIIKGLSNQPLQVVSNNCAVTDTLINLMPKEV